MKNIIEEHFNQSSLTINSLKKHKKKIAMAERERSDRLEEARRLIEKKLKEEEKIRLEEEKERQLKEKEERQIKANENRKLQEEEVRRSEEIEKENLKEMNERKSKEFQEQEKIDQS